MIKIFLKLRRKNDSNSTFFNFPSPLLRIFTQVVNTKLEKGGRKMLDFKVLLTNIILLNHKYKMFIK